MKLADEYADCQAIAYWQNDQGWNAADIAKANKDSYDARDALVEAVEELAKDAERYRWLRSLEHCNEAWCFIGEGNANSNLDKAIDQAMKGQS